MAEYPLECQCANEHRAQPRKAPPERTRRTVPNDAKTIGAELYWGRASRPDPACVLEVELYFPVNQQLEWKALSEKNQSWWRMNSGAELVDLRNKTTGE